MTVEATRTYLEMTSVAELRPGRMPGVRVTLQRVVGCPPAFYRFLYGTVGAEYHWIDRVPWTDEEIQTYLAQPSVELWVMYSDGAPAGYFELRGDDDGGTEIAYFGLLREFIGRGLGGHLLTEAIRRAFALNPSRVWLHTCTLDHPAAMRNYLERGFRIVREERYTAQLRQ